MARARTSQGRASRCAMPRRLTDAVTRRYLSPVMRSVVFIALGVGAAACAATPPSQCGSPAAPSAPAPSAPAPSPRSPSPAPFDVLRDRILDELLADDPSTARDLGLHQYDGKVAALSADALAARRARLDNAANELAAVDGTAL